MARIILFGHGIFYQRRKAALHEFLGEDQVIAFLDNAAAKARECDGLPVYLPEELEQLAYDYIVLMSSYLRPMREQLLELGVPAGKILFYEAYRAQRTRDTISLPEPEVPAPGRCRIVIVTHDLAYGGASLVIVYAAQVLRQLGYGVTLATPTADPAFAREVRGLGVQLAVCPTLPYLGEQEIAWLHQYDVLLVNCFQNYAVAMRMGGKMPVLWWLHEASERWCDIYPRILYQFADLVAPKLDGLRALAVSHIAKAALRAVYEDVPVGILPFGIPDTGAVSHVQHEPLVFALIGSIYELKGQRAFLRAAEQVLAKYSDLTVEFWLIGSKETGRYAQETLAMVERMPQARWLGTLTRQQMTEAYQHIDVVVCASHEETMSATIVEGLMQGLVCLTTQNTGVAAYLHDGVDGFIAADCTPEQLAAAMERVLSHRQDWADIGARGRQVYEETFSMQRFGEHLQAELENTIQMFAHKA